MFGMRWKTFISLRLGKALFQGLVLSLFIFSKLHADEIPLNNQYESYDTERPLDQFSEEEERNSRKNLRLDTDSVMEMEEAFVRILNEEFKILYKGDSKLFLADIRRGLMGVYRDNDGQIKSYRRLYAANLYSNYNHQAAEAVSEPNKENPAFRTHERITARTLVSDEEPRQRLVIGKYSSGKKWTSATVAELECPVLFVNVPLAINAGLSSINFEKTLRRTIASIQINDGQRVLVLSLNSQNEIEGGLYAPQVNGFKNYLPNPAYPKEWIKAKYGLPDAPHVKLAAISSFIQFASGVAFTFLLKPDNFHLAPALANGLFAILICSHSKTYERVVKSSNILWETFKRLLIAAPLGMAIAAINFQPTPLAAFSDPHTWYQVLVLSYLDRILSTVMNTTPRWRDQTGMSAGTFKIGKFDTGLPGDSTEREIPAILRNFIKFPAFLLISGSALIPSGTKVMLLLVPATIFYNIYWARKNISAHPRLKLELKNYLNSFNLWQKMQNGTPKTLDRLSEVGDFLKTSITDPEKFADRVQAKIESKLRRCKHFIASLR